MQKEGNEIKRKKWQYDFGNSLIKLSNLYLFRIYFKVFFIDVHYIILPLELLFLTSINYLYILQLVAFGKESEVSPSTNSDWPLETLRRKGQ